MLISTLVCALANPTSVGSKDVLFLGNSYTGVNNLPALVEGLAAAGGHSLATDRNTPGGNTLGAPQSSGDPHMSNATSLAKIAANDWDFVVLQDQSVIPSIPWARNNYMIPGAQSLDDSIDASDPNSRVLMYQTWGRRFGGSFCIAGHCQDFANFGEMQDNLTLSYALCASVIGAEVAPVGEAWRRAFELDPSIVLHTGDESHPHLRGSYLAACVFYAKIFDESPVGLTFTSGLDTATANFLQQVAAETVFCSWSNYCDLSPTSTSAGARILAMGSTRVPANNMSLRVEDAVPTQFGQFFYGATASEVPFGDGLLCVSGEVFRLGAPAAIGAAGRATLQLDFKAPPMNSGPGTIAAGTTWHFQFWFRDPAGPGGSGFNLSNALSAVFCP